jgi:hypothetical protein
MVNLGLPQVKVEEAIENGAKSCIDVRNWIIPQMKVILTFYLEI